TFILANDLIDITSKHHIAYLLDHDNVYKATTKEDIAQLIYEKVKKYD
ncbi:phosphopantothenate--cysteine ligase, partial [Streptococcus agalactiae]|nr:phosphopantothenate--cysteine ligase [Streptococcus agalactiae]